jgi:hypothetical protein
MRIVIPDKCLENTRFTKAEKRLIIKTLLMKMNLPVRRSKVVSITIPGLGTIHTHRNKKRLNKRAYMKRYNKKSWATVKKNQLVDKNYLLY